MVAASAWYFLAANRSVPVTSNALPPPAARLSLVALPFTNLSGDPAQDYLADALTDEVTTALARIYGAFVIARNTAFTYKGKPVDAKAIGKELGVRYVLEGSVQPSGNQVRVNAQLIDADSGAHLWADQFDTARADLLQTQDEIVTRLAHALDLQLPQVEAARLKRTPVANPDAEDLALQCQSAVQKGGYDGKEAEAGFPLCEQALALDPNNVRALVLLNAKFRDAVGLPERDLHQADELVSRALAIDPNAPGAHVGKAYVTPESGAPRRSARRGRTHARLDPANQYAYAIMGEVSIALGRFEKGLEFFDKAIRASPHDPALGYFYGAKTRPYNELKQYDQAIKSARRAIAINPNGRLPFAELSLAYNLTGRFEKGLEYCEKELQLNPRNIVCYIQNASAYFALRQYDQAIEWARRGIAIENTSFLHGDIIAALVLTGHEVEAREALKRLLELPPDADGFRTIAAWEANKARRKGPQSDAPFSIFFDRRIEGLRRAGLSEQ